MRNFAALFLLATTVYADPVTVAGPPPAPLQAVRVVRWTAPSAQPQTSGEVKSEDCQKPSHPLVAARCREQGSKFAAPNIISNLNNTAAPSGAAETGPGAPLSFEATIINNFADLLATRFQAEAVEIVADRFGSVLCNENIGGYDAHSFFPQSCALLRPATGTEINLIQLGKSFQSALQHDVQNLLPVVVALKPQTPTAPIVVPLAQIYASLQRGETPIGLIIAAADQIGCDKTDNIQCGLQLVGVATGSLLANSAWKTVDLDKPSDVDSVIADASKALARALADEQHSNLSTWVKKNVNVPNGPQTDSLLRNLLPPLQRLGTAIKADSQKASADERKQNALEIITRTMMVWRDGMSAINLSDQNSGINVIATLDSLTECFTALADKNIAAFLQSLYPLTQGIGIKEPLPPAIGQRYLPLIAGLVSAKDSTELARAFSAAGGPSADKTQQRDCVKASFDGMVGLTSGKTSQTWQGAVFAPVGFDVTAKRGLFGGLLTVLDLGVPTTARLSGNNQRTETKLSQVFSPGFYLRSNIYRAIVLGVGGSLGPAIQEQSGTNTRKWRTNAFLAIDVPFFSLF